MGGELFRIHFEVASDSDSVSKSIFFGPKTDLHFLEDLNFKFLSKTHFLNTKLEDLYCRICSYTP